MATERVDIVVSENGSRVVKRNLEDIGTAADKSGRSIGLLNKALALVGSFIGFRSIVDHLTNVEHAATRLEAVLNRTGNTTGRTFQQLLDMSNQLEMATGRQSEDIQTAMTNLATYSTISGDVFDRAIKLGIDMSEVYGYDLRGSLEGLARALDDPIKGFMMLQKRGFSLDSQQKEVIKSLILTGQSAKAQGIILNMLEAQVGGAAVDSYTGLTRAVGQLGTQFDNLVETLDKVTNFSGFIIGAADLLSSSLKFLADNAEVVSIAIAGIAGAAVVIALSLILSLIGAIAVALAPLIGIWVAVGAAIGVIVQLIFNYNKTMDDAVEATGRVVSLVDKFKATWAGSIAYVKAAWEDFPNWLASITIRGINQLIASVEWMVGRIVASFNTTLGTDIAEPFLGRLDEPQRFADAGDRAAKAYRDAYTASLMVTTTESIVPTPPGKPATDINKPDKRGKDLSDMIEKLRQQTEALMMEADARDRLSKIYSIQDTIKRKLTDGEKADLDQRLKIIQSLQREADIRDELARPLKDYTDTMEALNNLLADGKVNQDKYNESVRTTQLAFLETDRTVSGGLLRGVLKLQDSFSDLATTAENALTNAFGSAEDALVSFVTTGKTSVSDMVNSILADFARLAIRQSITGPLLSALGGALGGVLPGTSTGGGVEMVGSIGKSLGISGFRAAGGPVSPNSLYKVNENGPELLRIGTDHYLMNAGQAGAVTPASRGGQAGGVIMLQPIITNNISDRASVTTQTGQDANGQPTFTVMIDSVEKELSSRVDSGHSPLLTSMGRGLGVQPKPRGG